MRWYTHGRREQNRALSPMLWYKTNNHVPSWQKPFPENVSWWEVDSGRKGQAGCYVSRCL